MKTCGRIRGIILADYIDGELSANEKDCVEEHLAICEECRSLAEKVKSQMSLISDPMLKKEAPGYIWSAIRNDIEEGRAVNSIADLVKDFFENLTFPKLAPALAGILLVAVMGSFLMLGNYAARPLEGYEYIEEALGSGEVSLATVSEGLGTPIEKYFL